MLTLLLTLTTLATPPVPDTVRLTPAEAMQRVLEGSPVIEAADLRGAAGAAAADQARAFSNPRFSIAVENVGAAEEVTGLPAPEGLEGQAILGFLLPLGGDRSARIWEADALSRTAAAEARRIRGDVLVAAVSATAMADRDRRIAESAAEEARTLRQLADALTLQAAEGRASEGEAARARLEAAMAEGTAADVRAMAALSSAELARLMGHPPEAEVVVAAGACRLPAPEAGPAPLPEVEASRAREEAARAGADRIRAGRIPDLEPQVGWRRGAGTNGLYLGLGLDLPLFNRGGRAADAAAAELRAAEADLRATRARIDAEQASVSRGFSALEEAGARFRQGWAADLERAVEATEARYDLGEGTLVELLDGRRARLQALEARERWRAGWRVQRSRLFRLAGVEPTADLFCDPLASDD